MSSQRSRIAFAQNATIFYLLESVFFRKVEKKKRDKRYFFSRRREKEENKKNKLCTEIERKTHAHRHRHASSQRETKAEGGTTIPRPEKEPFPRSRRCEMESQIVFRYFENEWMTEGERIVERGERRDETNWTESIIQLLISPSFVGQYQLPGAVFAFLQFSPSFLT